MAIDLGGWGWAAGMAIDVGAPVIGAALGIPGLAGEAGQMLKRALGLSPNVSSTTVRNAIEADPEAAKAAFAAANSEASGKWDYLARAFEAQAEVAKTSISEVNETIRAEVSATAAKPDGWWGHWRTWMAYELMLECPFWAALIGWCIVYGKIGELTAAAGILSVWWAARFGVLGVHVWTGSNERQTAITGTTPAGAITTAVSAIKAVVPKK